MANARWDANIPALQAEVGMVNGEVALLAGWASAGDGGGGLVYFSTTIPAAQTITAASNAMPIQITTSAPHGLSTNQRVMIGGVGGNTAANNTGANPTWIITFVNSTNFRLNGSNGNGAYTSGGAIGDGGNVIPSNSSTTGIWTRIT